MERIVFEGVDPQDAAELYRFRADQLAESKNGSRYASSDAGTF